MKEEDLTKFLKNVDQISELVKELSAADAASQEKAVEKADCFLTSLSNDQDDEPCTTRLNRTAINTNPSQGIKVTGSQYDASQSPENFMKFFEKDAEERRERRRVKEEQANALKEKGNKAFAEGNYETAVNFYTDGLQQLRDMHTLYTNRAQAYIKLKKHREAIRDCEWALKCNDKCVKAYVHMGRAHLALGDYTESRTCYKKILDFEPEREVMVREYLTRVDLEEKKACQERRAWEEFEEGEETATIVPQLLKKLDEPKEIILYYCGGVELLSQAITNCTGQTLFRLNNGFSIINENKIVKSCLAQKTRDPHCEDLCVSVLKLWKNICDGNEENQQLLLQDTCVREHMVQSLGSQTAAVRDGRLALLCLYSQTQHGLRLLIENLHLHKLVKSLISCLSINIHVGATALSVLENLAAENEFRHRLRENFTALYVPALDSLLRNITATSDSLAPSFISVIGTMGHDELISRNLADCDTFWEACVSAMEPCARSECRGILYPLLGLLINTSARSAAAVQVHAVSISVLCVALLRDTDGGIITRAAGLLSTVLPKCQDASQVVVEKGIVTRLLRLLKGAGQTTSRYCTRALVACTASCPQACEEVVRLEKRLDTLRRLLGSADELVAGNAALCLGHCLAVRGAATRLLGTDAVGLLLGHVVGDARRAAVRRNAAIALGRLCQAEPRHTLKLRELHGLEILHSCMKLIT